MLLRNFHNFNSEKMISYVPKLNTHFQQTKMYNYVGVKSKLNFISDSLWCILLYIHSDQLMTSRAFAVNLNINPDLPPRYKHVSRMRKKTTRKEKQNKNLLIDEKVLIYNHTEIVIIRKEVCPTFKFENIDQVTFKCQKC